MWTDNNIGQKKRLISGCIKKPMRKLVRECASDWGNPEQLTKILYKHLKVISYCQKLYCFDVTGKQFSGSVSHQDINMTALGQVLSDRPYFQGLLPYNGMALSSVYLGLRNKQPCITALFAVREEQDLLGFVAADFYIHDLPKITKQSSEKKNQWAQYKGDPSIRKTVFMQQRTYSHFDQRLDRVIYLVYILLRKHGVFHVQIDFSSSRLVVWSIDMPYNYQVLSVDELFSNQLTQMYAKQSYPEDALIPESSIMDVLSQFKLLRDADENIYLRSGTINIANGTIGLTFSCDGFHLMSVEEFLAKDIKFWIGEKQTQHQEWRNMPLLESA